MLGALRALRAGGGDAAAVTVAAPAREEIPTVPLADYTAEDYERLRGPAAHLRFRIEPPASPASLMRQLGVPPTWSLEESPADVFGQLSQAAGVLARELALRQREEVG